MYESLSHEYFNRVADLMGGINFVSYVWIFQNKFIIYIYLCNIYTF